MKQVSICIRTVNDNLEVKEDFLSFYELENIKSITVINAIKNISVWTNVPWSQQYDEKEVWCSHQIISRIT